MSLTIEEYRGLSKRGKARRCHELSDRDRFIARMEDWGAPGPGESVSPPWEELEAETPAGWAAAIAHLKTLFPKEEWGPE